MAISAQAKTWPRDGEWPPVLKGLIHVYILTLIWYICFNNVEFNHTYLYQTSTACSLRSHSVRRHWFHIVVIYGVFNFI